jgi:hypothetical protein
MQDGVSEDKIVWGEHEDMVAEANSNSLNQRSSSIVMCQYPMLLLT